MVRKMHFKTILGLGCDMLLYPAAFNMTTGPLHWELLQRARANDLQLFVATISPGKPLNKSESIFK